MGILDFLKEDEEDKKKIEELLAEKQKQLQAAHGPIAGVTTTTTTTTTNTSGITWTAPTSGTYTISGSTMYSPIGVSLGGPSLTPEEVQEMKDLEAEMALKLKYTRLEQFKKLDSSLRQQVVNAYEWQNCVSNMNALAADTTPRLAELRTKKNNSGGGLFIHGNGSISVSGWSYSNNISLGLGLPENISFEDLKRAHIEATMEEEMLGKPNS